MMTSNFRHLTNSTIRTNFAMYYAFKYEEKTKGQSLNCELKTIFLRGLDDFDDYCDLLNAALPMAQISIGILKC